MKEKEIFTEEFIKQFLEDRREDALRDYRSDMRAWREEGREEGKKEKSVDTAKKMLDKNYLNEEAGKSPLQMKVCFYENVQRKLRNSSTEQKQN